MKTEEIFAVVQMMFESKFKAFVPAATGNMRYHATVCTQTGLDEITIKIDDEIAPYVVFTNEPWVSPKWNGKKNPNEKWFQKTTENFIAELGRQLGGVTELEDGGDND